MDIIFIDKMSDKIINQATALISQILTCNENPTDEMLKLLEDGRICLVAVEGDDLLGLVGAIPQYSHAWELHPLVVEKTCRGNGVGRTLLSALEAELAGRGILTIYLGSDDEEFKTSLSEGDLFEDTYY